MKKLAIILMMLMHTCLFADVWQIKVKSDGVWKTQTVSKAEFIQIHDSYKSKILSVYTTTETTANIKNFSKAVHYEISVATLPGVDRVKLIHYYQKKENNTNHE